MSPRAVAAAAAVARIRLELERTGQARSVLRGLDAGRWPAVRRGAVRLANAVAGVEVELSTLAHRIGRRGLSEFRQDRLAELCATADRAIAESFALTTGVLLRRHAGFDEACREAESLVDELAGELGGHLSRPVVPGAGEERRRSVDVIVRRTPDHGLWDLPVMAHEFGHVVASDLDLYDPETATILPAGRDPAGWGPVGWPGRDPAHGEELFCDVFATYAVGPAYACSLLLHRLDPTSTVDSRTHPADVLRAEVVLAALRRLGESGPADRHRALTDRLESLWAELVGTHRPPVGDDLRGAVGSTLGFLDRHLGALRYHWPPTVVRTLKERIETGSAAPVGPAYHVRDVLSAAWLLRLTAWRAGREPDPAVAGRARRLILPPVADDDAA